MSKYERYPKYKDSGVEWLGKVPGYWQMSKLKYDSYIKARVGWHGLTSDELFEDGDAYAVTGSDFLGNSVNWKDCRKCTLERYKQDKFIQLQDDDLLVTKDGTIGKIIKVNKLPDLATLNGGIFVIRPLQLKYNTSYYYWLLLSTAFHGFVSYYKTGSTISHLYQDTFCQMPYALPPLQEQQAIANYLDKATIRIDTLIEKQTKLVALLKEKRQAVISHAVNKGLDPNVKMKDSGVKWLEEVPMHWVTCTLRHLVTLVDGDRGKEYPNDKDFKDIGIPFLSSKNIIAGKLDLTDVKYISNEKFISLNRGKVIDKDLIVKVRGSTGRIGEMAQFCIQKNAYRTAFINAQMMIIRTLKELLPEYLLLLSQSHPWKEQLDLAAYGTAQQQLSNEVFSNLALAVPNLLEQKTIIKYLNTQTEKMDTLIEKANQAIILLKERRTALIGAAVTGKIDVRGKI